MTRRPMPEITDETRLCTSGGDLDPAAVGWTRRPLHVSNLHRWARTKRWEYWCVQTPELVLAITVSDLEYAGLHAVYVLDPSGREHGATHLAPLGRVELPERCCGGPVRVRSRHLSIDIEPGEQTVLRAGTDTLGAEIVVDRSPDHESLGVVVPWSRRRFQYTVKQNTMPARGWVDVEGQRRTVDGPDAWAALDHGRGRWPYRVLWNWGSGSGYARMDGARRVVGVQLGGAWTDGTGSTENALVVDGVVHVIPNDLRWEYDRTSWTAPWRVTDPVAGRVDLELRPTHERRDRMQLGVLFNETHQCFGTWHGVMVDDDGSPVLIDGVRGWAEEVRNRW